MGEQRDRAKADAKAKKSQHADARRLPRDRGRDGRARCAFTGYDEVVSEGVVRGIVAADGSSVQSAHEGDEIELVLDRTPFYAEGGGQLADQGVIELANGAPAAGRRRADADHRRWSCTGRGCWSARCRSARPAQLLVDVERRRSISRSHTATHMVHKAFREALGETATQAGSENCPGRFRFDFSATGAVPESAMADVEARVNDLVLADLAVHAELMTPGGGREVRRDGAVRREVRRRGARRSRSATGRASSAAARTPAGPASSAWSSCSASPRSAPAYAGWRRWSAATPTGSWPASTCSSRSSATLLKVRPEQLPERVSATSSTGCARRRRRSRRSASASCSPPAATLAAGAEDVHGVAFVGPPRRRRRRRRRAHAGARRARPAARRPARRGRASSASRTASRRSWWRSTTPRASAGSAPTPWSGRPAPSSAAPVAARTTSPRAAAPTRPRRRPGARRRRRRDWPCSTA